VLLFAEFIRFFPNKACEKIILAFSKVVLISDVTSLKRFEMEKRHFYGDRIRTSVRRNANAHLNPAVERHAFGDYLQSGASHESVGSDSEHAE
jgi:hypothetical protein